MAKKKMKTKRNKPYNPHKCRPRTDKPLTEQQIIEMLVAPRACLDRMIVGGGIEFNDLGSLQCCYVLAAQIENITGIQSPDNKMIVGLVDQIECGMEIIEDRIDRVRNYINEYAAYLRRVPGDAVRQSIDKTRALIAE